MKFKSQFYATFLFLLVSVPVKSSGIIKAFRINETNPSTTAYVLTQQEQLSGQAFQQDALVTYNGFQYTVYYNSTRNVCISRRKLPFGEWKEVIIPFRNTEDDAHDVISMGICKNDGTIHLAYDHHNTTLQYCRSAIGLANDTSMSWNISNFGPNTSQMVAYVTVPDVTYPRFINKPDGDLLFECRYKLSGDGDSYLREYSGAKHTWTLIGRYVQGMDSNPNACAYINRMDYDVFGRLHVSWCWRDNYDGQSNHDIFYGYSEDNGRTWKDNTGKTIATTEKINPTDSRVSGSCMRQGIGSLKIETIPYNKGYINQETQTCDGKGRVHIVNSYMNEGTDSNWASSRKKAVLHHRYRDSTGVWHHNLIKRNGVNVNSYCRVQVITGANDDAFVIANGAEIYAATSASGYTDWNLLSDTDAGRFCSEPQIDQMAIKKGVLSFVYLGRDKKITVIDYLLDNPSKPYGKGLNAQYYSNYDFTELINSSNDATFDKTIPENAKSVRWSGYFETILGEKYTLTLNTSAASTVYVNGEKVLETGDVSTPGSFTFNYKPVCSHMNNIVIEAKADKDSKISLDWSSERTTKEPVPAVNLYSFKDYNYPNDIPSVKSSKKKVRFNTGDNKSVHISEMPDNSAVKVYSLNGTMLKATYPEGSETEISLPSGYYLISVSNTNNFDSSFVCLR
jgi:hypothetical protein